MRNFKLELEDVKAFAFDVDGVLSPTVIPTSAQGEPMRMANIKDGYALQLAIKRGYPIAIITGGDSPAIPGRYNMLGITDIYMKAGYKIDSLDHFLKKYHLLPDSLMYMGDDIPDYQVMKRVGFPCCPNDAVSEIKSISSYISPYLGGHGCCRDVIEQVLKAQNKWMDNAEAFGW